MRLSETLVTKTNSQARDRILTIAVDEFMEKGAQSLSLRGISKKAGLTPMAIYRHFEDKQALVEEIIRVGFEEYASYLTIDRKPDEVAHLEALAARVFDFAAEKSAFFEIIFLTSQTAIGLPDRGLLREVHGPTYDIAKNALADCRSAGKMRFSDLRHTTNDVLAWCIGACAIYLSGMTGQDRAKARKDFRRGFRRIINPYLNQPN